MSDNVRDWICTVLKVAEVAALIVLVGVVCCRSCRGDVEIKRPAGDGVNVETIRIDDKGFVTSRSVTAAYAPERFTGLQSGERVWIGDFEYVVIAKGDWALLTNRIERLETVAANRWANEHKTVAGRQAWHGAATNRVVGADGLSVTWLYPDGYTYTEREARTNAVRRVTSPRRPNRPSDAPAPVRRAVLPPRLAAKQNALKSRPGVREVNAVFGPGGKVLKVEEVAR